MVMDYDEDEDPTGENDELVMARMVAWYACPSCVCTWGADHPIVAPQLQCPRCFIMVDIGW